MSRWHPDSDPGRAAKVEVDAPDSWKAGFGVVVLGVFGFLLLDAMIFARMMHAVTW
jgi:hypothetical protein